MRYRWGAVTDGPQLEAAGRGRRCLPPFEARTAREPGTGSPEITMKEKQPEIQLVYASAAARRMSRDEVLKLLAVARVKNEALGVTGMLLYLEDSFFQVLEGEAGAVRTLYARIEQDDRHAHVVKLLEEPIEERTFARWSMGYADVTRLELASIPGLNDFLDAGPSFSEIGPGRARSLLSAFKEGKWRRRLGR